MVIAPFIFGIVPALLWLAFFLAEDRDHPEPKRIIAYVFIAGGLAASLAAVFQFLLQQQYPSPPGPAYASPSLLPFAFIEELSKFIVVYLIVKKLKYFDERIDSMIYMVTAGLGFAALENFLNLFQSQIIIEVVALRAIGATLLHAVASGILGFHWARGHLIAGLVAATLLHWGFNYLILFLHNTEIYASLLLFLAAIFLLHDFEILKAMDRFKRK